MVDSRMIVKQWIDALYNNQSTNEYGRLDENGAMPMKIQVHTVENDIWLCIRIQLWIKYHDMKLV